MERGSLRPVPLRPPGPVDPAEAARHVGLTLPALDDQASRALALVEIAGRSRDDAIAELGLDADGVAAALARARKALRRSIFPLAATGWCERAERLLSDRLDGVLGPPGAARLDVHLRHCGRCVEHERRLAQARETLVHGYVEAHAPPPPEPEPEPAPPVELRVVEHVAPIEEAPVAPPAPARTPTPREAPRVPAVAGQGSAFWNLLYASGIVLALVAAILTVLAATGAVERVF
jgi:hypothetical protein